MLGFINRDHIIKICYLCGFKDQFNSMTRNHYFLAGRGDVFPLFAPHKQEYLKCFLDFHFSVLVKIQVVHLFIPFMSDMETNENNFVIHLY